MDDVSDAPEVDLANSVSAEVVVTDSDEMMADSETQRRNQKQQTYQILHQKMSPKL